MKRFSSTASLALAVVVILGLTGPVAAGEQVPFKGSFEGDVTVTPLTPPYLQVDVDATGSATHLGQFTLDIPHIVNAATRTAIGSYEFIAANGDTRRPLHRGNGNHHGRYVTVRGRHRELHRRALV